MSSGTIFNSALMYGLECTADFVFLSFLAERSKGIKHTFCFLIHMQPTFHSYRFLVNKFMTQLGGGGIEIEISFILIKTYFLLLKSIIRNTFCC